MSMVLGRFVSRVRNDQAFKCGENTDRYTKSDCCRMGPPCDSVQLRYQVISGWILWFNELVFMGFSNQHSHHVWWHHPWWIRVFQIGASVLASQVSSHLQLFPSCILESQVNFQEDPSCFATLEIIPLKDMGMGQNLLLPYSGESRSINQVLFGGTLGARVLTHSDALRLPGEFTEWCTAPYIAEDDEGWVKSHRFGVIPIYIYIYISHIGSMYGIYADIWGILMVNVTILNDPAI